MFKFNAQSRLVWTCMTTAFVGISSARVLNASDDVVLSPEEMREKKKRVLKQLMEEERARSLFKKLKCLECANQTIDSSDAPIAVTLRQMVVTMVKQGREEEDIIDNLKEKYGQNVIYDPPFDWKVAILWASPVVLGLVGISWFVLGVKSPSRSYYRLIKDSLLNPVETEEYLNNVSLYEQQCRPYLYLRKEEVRRLAELLVPPKK